MRHHQPRVYKTETSTIIMPCVKADHTLTQEQLIRNLETCLSQLRERERNRRYYIQRQPVDWMDVSNWPADIVRNIFGDQAIKNGPRIEVPVQQGPAGDRYHNIRGFLASLEYIEQTRYYLQHPWRLYTEFAPGTIERIERESSRSRPMFGAMGQNPSNLILRGIFTTEQEAREMAFANPGTWYYLFHFDDFVEQI